MDPRIRIRIHTKISGEVKPLYEAESPDELALIDAAYAYNCKLLKRSPDRLTVSLPGDGQVSVAGVAEISAAGQKRIQKKTYMNAPLYYLLFTALILLPISFIIEECLKRS